MTRELNVEAIERALTTRRFGRPVYGFDAVGSTNDEAAAYAARGAPEGTAVIARVQTGGRGRRGRAWRSPPGGLWMSVVVRPDLAVERWPLVGIAAAVAAARAVTAGTGVRVGLKWPNDLVVDGRKLGGILIEAAAAHAVAGVGINVNVAAADLPADVGATSLRVLLGRDVDLISLACDLLARFEEQYELLASDPSAVLAAWRERAILLGRAVRVTGARDLAGIAVDVDGDGALLIDTPAGRRRVVAGDVSLRPAEEQGARHVRDA